MVKKQSTDADDPTASLGARLLTALTHQEIAQLLDAQLAVLAPEQRTAVLAQLPVNTRQTIQQILAAPALPMTPAEPTAAPGEPQVSLAKLAETWATLWAEWDRVIREAGDEEGDYYDREEDWEPPYFDANALMEDLEKVAVKLQPLVRTAFENSFLPNHSFAEALQAAAEEVIDAKPEWIEITEGFAAEQQLTECLLEWEWLATLAEGGDAYTFAARIRAIEEELDEISLHEDAVIDWFTALAVADQQRVLQGMRANAGAAIWQQPLQTVHSHWHAIYMYYIEQYAPEYYLDNLRLTIPQQWQNGLPVLEDLVKKHEYPTSLTVIQEITAALLQQRQVTTEWTPTTVLVAPTHNAYPENPEQGTDYQTFLQLYQQTSRGLGQPELVNALELQLVGYTHFYDWQRMLAAFANITVPVHTQQALFRSWQQQIVQRAEPERWGWGAPKLSAEWWLPWLIESVAEPSKGSAWFQAKITAWLAALPGDRKSIGGDWGRLRLLTKDLTVLRGKGQNPYPKFYEIVIRPQELSTPDDPARQSYLQQSAPPDLWTRLIEYWRKHLHQFVPNPAQVSNGEYSSHAQWLAALREMAPENYAPLLERWRIDHHRRRNLWKALAAAGLDR